MAEPRYPESPRGRSKKTQLIAAAQLEEVCADASACRACPLWQGATQTVFGEGRVGAAVMLVGEVPGDREDREGHPFVGPAGRLLDRALRDAGIDRDAVYITNAVKHFKFELRGKRRMHKTPAQKEIEACHPWLESELALVRPAIVVAMGATAVRSLLGRRLAIGENRGHWFEFGERGLFLTVHPSALLRIPEEGDRAGAYALFVAELKQVAARLRGVH